MKVSEKILRTLESFVFVHIHSIPLARTIDRKYHVDMSKKLTERNKLICDIRKEGKSLGQIAKMFNLTRERIRQISDPDYNILRKFQPSIVRKATQQTREWYNDYSKTRYKNDVLYRLARLLRNRFRMALKNSAKTGSALSYLGCSIEELRAHLEKQFKSKMSWKNYGKWHIDHIKPLSSFDLSKKEQCEKALHYTNLQPLWAIDNIKKGAK